jgi:hypothetical protein
MVLGTDILIGQTVLEKLDLLADCRERFIFVSQWVVGEGDPISPIIGAGARVQVSELLVEKV